MRCGVIAKKVGMSRLWDDKGVHLPVTVLLVDSKVVDIRTYEKHGYAAIQIGSGVVKIKNINKPMSGFFSKKEIDPVHILKEFRVSGDVVLTVGSVLSVTHFGIGQYVDVTGVSIGKGFSGVMKRHNFGGLRSSHGTSISHRSHGSTGQNQDPGRVFKGKKMAGHLGASRVTVQNLQVVTIDADRNLLFVKGAVPGCKNGYVFVRDSIKKSHMRRGNDEN